MALPVVSVAQMREWEAASWASGRKEEDVIARVGELVARRATQMTRPGDLIFVLAGKGHNGDDARRAREYMSDWRVYLRNVTDPMIGQAEMAALMERKPALVIDGLIGIGLNRPLDDNWAAMIQRVNDLQTQVLAIDVPSGLNADTGVPEGAAIKATVTLTLGAPKQGLLMPTAWEYTGRLEVASDIGLGPCPAVSAMHWILPGDFHGYPGPRGAASHKGDYGRVAIVAGSMGYHGAAVLAARAAQRAQPGLITLYVPETIYRVTASQLQAVMVAVWKPILKLPGENTAVLIGPGMAAEHLPDELKLATKHIWRDSPVPVVVDASGLDWIPQGPYAAKNALRVITPHPGEAARLLRTTAQQVQADRSGALREISRRLGNCWVVLKGHQTLIGRSTGEICVNGAGNPHLAQGGSGDVLAGYLAGLLAQPEMQADPARTLCYGVWQHGAAADRLTSAKANWVVEDLLLEVGNGAKVG